MKHIALLRGINVGGKRKILMADLRDLFGKLGYSRVETYIQSGNVVFETPEGVDPEETALQIKEAIRKKYDYEVPVMVIPSSEIRQAVDQNPYDQKSPEDIKKLHVTFLKNLPDQAQVEVITAMDHSPDGMMIKGKQVFIRCEGKYHQSKLTNGFFEKKLGVQATTRNWKTVLKLADIVGED